MALELGARPRANDRCGVRGSNGHAGRPRRLAAAKAGTCRKHTTNPPPLAIPGTFLSSGCFGVNRARACDRCCSRQRAWRSKGSPRARRPGRSASGRDARAARSTTAARTATGAIRRAHFCPLFAHFWTHHRAIRAQEPLREDPRPGHHGSAIICNNLILTLSIFVFGTSSLNSVFGSSP